MLRVYKIKTLDAYISCANLFKNDYAGHLKFINSITPNINEPFFTTGYSYTASEIVDFENDFNIGGSYPHVNWRENLKCPKTYLNNRMRASIHLCDTFLNICNDSKIYLTEQITPLYKFYNSRFSNLVGSEYLGREITRGLINENSIRNEDLTQLTFENNSFNIILSFDVFEHVPEFKTAFVECYRVLTSSGRLFFTVPFNPTYYRNITRATCNSEGTITHLLPPQYHGDPLSNGGVLCYHDYGWELLDDLLNAGFSDAYALIFWSKEFGYFTQQIAFIAEKK